MPILPDDYAPLAVPIPVRHRRKVPFRPPIRLPTGAEATLREIASLDRDLSELVVPAAAFEDRIQDVVASNLHSSVALEGNPLSLAEVRAVVRDSFRGRRPRTPPPPRQEILNHLAVWLLPEQLGAPWTIETLTELHAHLLVRVDPRAHPGRLRTTRAGVYSDRNELVFVPAPPEHIRSELGSLLTWLGEDARALSPLVAATVFFHEF